MQDYRRIVSYIHTYENNEKKKNVGFGKLEARGGIGKLSIQINGQSMLEGSVLSVYLLQIAEYANGIRLGECRVLQGRVNAEFRFNTENIVQSGYDLSKMQGIYITTEAAPYAVFASSWTDAQIFPDKFRSGESVPENSVENEAEDAVTEYVNMNKPENVTEMVTNNKELQEELASNDENPTAQEEQSFGMVQAAVIANDISAEINEDSLLASFMESLNQMDAMEAEEQEVNAFKVEMPGMFEADCIEAGIAESESVENEDIESKVIEDSASDSNEMEYNNSDNFISEELLSQMELDTLEKTPWEELCSKYPKVIAFEGADQPHRMCLRIDLRDLNMIAGAKREMSENTYLVRCYYKYRYLLLIENDNDKEGKSCILGIPGTYCRNECNLARMFGFEEFRPVKITENMNGRFGYWCKVIYL